MIIPIKRSEKELEWVLIEFQGNIKNNQSPILNDEYLGSICFNESQTPVLLTGTYIIIGKESELPKPFAVLEKRCPDDSETEKYGDSDIQTEYFVKAIIKRKVTFKGRPKFIITSVPRVT